MRVAIIYDKPRTATPQLHWLARSRPDGGPVGEKFTDVSTFWLPHETGLIEGLLHEGGYETVAYEADDARGLVEFLSRESPDLIFNCCDTLRGRAAFELNVAAIFELFEIPFTGSSALTLGMALNKGVAKSLFAAHGIPTPPWVVLVPGADPLETAHLRFPVIVKPIHEDASIGIDRHAIVDTRAALLERARFVWREFSQPALAEEFIEGREVNVALIGTAAQRFVTLPISEVLFDGFPAGAHRLLSYEAKWLADSPEYRSTVSRCPAELAPDVADRVRLLALNAATAVQLRDYGRIDFRIRRSDDAVFVLEANPNPDLMGDSDFVKSAAAAGRTHASVVREIVERALARARPARPI